VLLASSPVFLFQLVQPISDVPVTAWWALALALLLSGSRTASLGAGVAVGLAILTRPNLVFIAIVPGCWLLWNAVRAGRWTGLDAQRVWLFAAGVVPLCIGLGVMNTVLYGSPLASGYGDYQSFYSLDNVAPNVARYSRWLVEAQTPLVLLALFAPFLLGRVGGSHGQSGRSTVVMWIAFIIAVFACYVSFLSFDAWWFLRFLLPAFPPILIFVAVSLAAIARRLAGPARIIATTTVVALLAWRGAWYSLDRGVFAMKEGERKYAAVGAWVARRLPERAVVITELHSGSIRYYAGRLTMRWTWIPETDLDAVVGDLVQRGYVPYFLLEPAERDEFTSRFRGLSQFAELDWPPSVTLRHASEVRIYDPRDRVAARQGQPIHTEIIR